MILYRTKPLDNEEKFEKQTGLNTFDYNDEKEYYHFFILPENAEVYKHIKTQMENKTYYVFKCDIPYELIKNNFGVGMYNWYYPHKKTPFLEVRINKNDFNEGFILEKSPIVKKEWLNEEIYNRFMKDCVDSLKPINILNYDPLEVQLNKEFNFLDYFTKEDLEKENIDTSNYPKPIDKNIINYYKMMNDNVNKRNLINKLIDIKDRLFNSKSRHEK